ncbi:hypothetical protein UCDDS831_g09298 [Diplodia seriata]|uniref:Lysine-specific metallo-endopeptidase domain-containing protein n=1 Tax=Diplodia seriata TaxID=420778 RepID=A0A0G2DS69_9PEZI|nr:hypothetical protein UCDDS831_g09298 [Diplodia seriata]
MISPFSMVGLSWGLLSTMAVVTALPHNVLPRDGKTYQIIGCTAAQQKKLTTAFEDAVKLASAADDIDDDSTAFSHYLRKDDKKETKKLWKAVAKVNSDDSPYKFNVRCDNLAYTNPSPADDDNPVPEMTICPAFFTNAGTKNDLESKSYIPDKRNSWCQTDYKFKDFETAGHTILHELTHFDAVGDEGDLPEATDEGITSHGTIDVVGFGDDYVPAARAFLQKWVADPDTMKKDDGPKPYQNAENVAAAATEWWFNNKCTNIDNIDV